MTAPPSDRNADEETPLNGYLLPSPSSTDRSTYTSLGASLTAIEDHSMYIEGGVDPNAMISDTKARVSSCYNPGWRTTKIIPVVIILALPVAYILSSSRSSSSTIFPHASPPSAGTTGYKDSQPKPFSTLDPLEDLNLYGFDREADTAPPRTIHRPDIDAALPTNAWYQNLLLGRGEPTELQRVYTVPHMVDVAGPIPGLQIHPNHIDATSTVIQLSYVQPHGLTLGAAVKSKRATSVRTINNEYSVLQTTPLGITLAWNSSDMTASIVRGMPYMTVTYPPSMTRHDTVLPTIAAHGPLRGFMVGDGQTKIPCDSGKEYLVERDLLMTFDETDFTWIAFFSKPVLLHCVNVHATYGGAALQFVSNHEDDEALVARVALVTNCTAGRNPLYCRGWDRTQPIPNHQDYIDFLRTHANAYPGNQTDVQYQIDHDHDKATLTLDWDVQQMSHSDDPPELITFALPHQLSYLGLDGEFCRPAMLGRACIVTGSTWTIPHTLPPIGFRAARPPKAQALPALSQALQKDFEYRVPGYFMRGAGDTYFSGKILAKAARILVIADEVKELCSKGGKGDYADACRDSTVPTDLETTAMLNMLRAGVEIWINGTAEAPFVYDKGWGGLVNCGCYFNGKTKGCDNKFPNCPAFTDQGLNFGNGFYNDHHFHYGYHIYAAAVVARFDPEWGRNHFEGVKLLIRDFANPSPTDTRFPLFRHKDWYEGHSWASGIPLPAYLNGRNQESSSEAIAAYEAVALFGEVMVDAWKGCHDCANTQEHELVSSEIRNVGRLLLATEIRSTDRYWHVRLKNETLLVYPAEYTHNVVGMLWNTMAQFQTWFGNAPYLPYGIQLLPITAISEQRDDPAWLEEMYVPFAEACNEATACETDGWSVLQLAVLAAVGHFEMALERTQALSADVFESAGGNGHSRSNTIWFIATRPDIEPIVLPKSDSNTSDETSSTSDDKVYELTDCNLPGKCTDSALDADADGFTCRERITWLIQTLGKSQSHACAQVGGIEFPSECGACSTPGGEIDNSIDKIDSHCPPCTDEICNSDLNRCPIYERTFLCTHGPSAGGCQGYPWPEEPQCAKCCETTKCPRKVIIPVKKVIDPSVCPPCTPDVCRKSLCPPNVDPYFCSQGPAAGGCSPRPWDLAARDCKQCCTVMEGCK